MKKKSQVEVVMGEFEKGRLRDSHGKTVKDPKQAKAIAMSEERSAKKRGREERTWRGRTRLRPNKSK